MKIRKLKEVVEDRKFIKESENLLEALMTFGGKAYPKFGQIIILAGGAGSGKGFVKSKLLGADGIVLDVDELKKLVMASTTLAQKLKDGYGIDVKNLNLRKSEDVSALHDVVSQIDLNNKKINTIFKSIMNTDPTRKSNIIFDVTLKDMTKFHNLMRQVENMGYWKKNIHLVWILNTIDVAMAQNKTRSRVVADEILLATHTGANYTINQLLKMGNKLQKYLDGEIYLAFNQAEVDTNIEKSDKGGMYIKDADYVKLKEQQKAPLKISEIEKRVVDKIKRYVPDADIWN